MPASFRHLVRLTRVIALSAMFAAPGQAAVVTACGPNICYEYDDAQAAIVLTGAPTLVGDDMQFLPAAFGAHSTGVAGWHLTTANFIFARVYTVNPLNEIATFHAFEEFDYEIITDGEVRATLYTQARSNLVSADTTSTLINWSDAGDTGGAQIETLNAYLFPAAHFVALAQDMRVTIQNTLRAYADALAEDAFIQKKFTLMAVTTQPAPAVVPVPATLWLLGSALGLLGIARRARCSLRQ